MLCSVSGATRKWGMSIIGDLNKPYPEEGQSKVKTVLVVYSQAALNVPNRI